MRDNERTIAQVALKSRSINECRERYCVVRQPEVFVEVQAEPVTCLECRLHDS